MFLGWLDGMNDREERNDEMLMKLKLGENRVSGMIGVEREFKFSVMSFV